MLRKSLLGGLLVASALFGAANAQQISSPTNYAVNTYTLLSTDSGSAIAPVFDCYRNSASPAVNDALCGINFSGNSSTGVKRIYGQVSGYVRSPTNAAERGGTVLSGMTAGALTDVMVVDGFNGVVIGGLNGNINNGNLSFVANGAGPTGTTVANFTVSGNNLKLAERNTGGFFQEWDYSSGDTSIGGARAAEALRVIRTASAVNRVEITGAVTAGAVAVASAGSDTNVRLQLRNKGAEFIDFMRDTAVGFRVGNNVGVPTDFLRTDPGTGASGNSSIYSNARNMVLGTGAALATGATVGHIMIPTVDGTPTGAVTGAGAGAAPFIFDSTNKKFCVLDVATWRCSAAM